MNSLKFTENKQLIRANAIILGVFSFFFLTKLLHWFPKDISQGINIWAYTDWLIDYSSGFVRRGLSGELVDWLSNFAHPRFIIGVLTWSIFGSVVFGYMRLLSRSIKTLSPFLFVALLFLPSLLPFYLYDHGAFGRKEIIGYLILLYHLYSLETHKTANVKKLPALNSYIKKILPITLVFLPIHVLIHESSFLLFVPVHMTITYTILQLPPSSSFRRKIFILLLLYLPALLAFLAIFFFGRPSFEVALNICNKWELANALEAGSCSISGNDTKWALPGSFTALPWSFSQAASLPLAFIGKKILAWVTNFLIMGFSTVYIGSMVVRLLISNYSLLDSGKIFARQHSKGIFYKYFLLPLIISAPLYVLGRDIGRWFAVSCINYIMISLSEELNYAESVFGVGAKLITKLLQVLTIVVGGAMILVGSLADWIIAGREGFGQQQILAVSIGCGLLCGLLFIHLLGQRFWRFFNQSPNEKSNLWYYINLFFLLLILFSIRLPHCCHNGYKMLAEPFTLLAQKILSTP